MDLCSIQLSETGTQNDETNNKDGNVELQDVVASENIEKNNEEDNIESLDALASENIKKNNKEDNNEWQDVVANENIEKNNPEDKLELSDVAAYENIENNYNVEKVESQYVVANENIVTQKPTFKNVLQAKRRLLAFGAQKDPPNESVIKNKLKEILTKDKPENGSDDLSKNIKKSPKKVNPDDKAKSIIADIEKIKKDEYYKLQKPCSTLSKFNSPESDSVFRKREIKSRNIRKSEPVKKSRSRSRERPHKSAKPNKWKEYSNMNCSINKYSKNDRITSQHDIYKNLLFEGFSKDIVPYYAKTPNGESKLVPFSCLRYTSTKPRISYSTKQKIVYMSRAEVLKNTNVKFKNILENFFKSSAKPRSFENTPMKTRSWYRRNWIKFSSTDEKAIENSIGLSFLKNYSDHEEENDNIKITSHNLKMEIGKDKIKLDIFENKDDGKSKPKEASPIISTTPEKRISDKLNETEDNLSSCVKYEKNTAKLSLTPERPLKKEPIESDNLKENKSESTKKLKIKKKKSHKHKNDTSSSSSSDEKIKKKKTGSQKHKNKKESKKKDIKLKVKKKNKKIKKAQRDKSVSDDNSANEKSHKRSRKSSSSSDESSDSEEKERKKSKKKKTSKDKESKISKSKVKSEIIVMKQESDDLRNLLDKKSNKPTKTISENEDVEPKRKKKRSSSSSPQEDKEEKIKKKLKKEKLKLYDEEKAAKRKLEKKSRKRMEFIRKSNLEDEFPLRKDQFDILPKFLDVKKLKLENENLAEETITQFKKSSKLKDDDRLTPDADEYHSNWESEDEISSALLSNKNSSLDLLSVGKLESLSWENEEENIKSRIPSDIEVKPIRRATPPLLEMPLTIKTFSRRQPTKIIPKIELPDKDQLLNISVSSEILCKDILHESKIKRDSPIFPLSVSEETKELKSDKSDKGYESAKTPESSSKDAYSSDFSIFALSSPEPTMPIKKELENEYEEFMKSLSTSITEDDELIQETDNESSITKLQDNLVSSAKITEKEATVQEIIDGNKDVKNKKTKDITLDDISIPDPAPVPSPKSIDISSKIQLNLNISNISPIKRPIELDPNRISFDSPTQDLNIETDLTANLLNTNIIPQKKIFSFTSLVLPKKSTMVEKSNWKIENDSDEEDPTEKKAESEEHLDEKTHFKEIDTETLDKDKIDKKQKQIKDRSCVDIKRKELNRSKDEERKPDRRRSRSRSPLHKEREKKLQSDHRESKESYRSRKRSPENRRESPGRRFSPSYRRRESPRKRREPLFSFSSKEVRGRSAERKRSSTPIKRKSHSPKYEDSLRRRNRSPVHHKSPTRHGQYKKFQSPSPLSPQHVLKRSVADSTISDDMLPQPSLQSPALDASVNSPAFTTVSSTAEAITDKKPRHISPKRISLDERINQVLGLEISTTAKKPVEEPIKTVPDFQTYPPYDYKEQNFAQGYNYQYQQSKVKQIGNNLEVVPSQDPYISQIKKPQNKILQVGNMLQIVPTDIIPSMPVSDELPPLPKDLPFQILEGLTPDTKQINFAEERLKERDKRRLEREQRRLEKEQKKTEKQRQKHLKLKTRTENLIKRALELEKDDLDEETVTYLLNEKRETSINHWPPVPIVVSTVIKDPGKSILINNPERSLDEPRLEGRKSVQFADGIRPGEGTSPSGGEELSSPPPPPSKRSTKKLKKLKLIKKAKKRKVKVKVIKKRAGVDNSDDDEDYENLPPPSPPPGSPPPHIFPPRVKVHTVNNIRPQHFSMPPQIPRALQVPPPTVVQNHFRNQPGQYPIPHLMAMDHMQRPPPPLPSPNPATAIAYQSQIDQMQHHMPAMPVHRHYDHHPSC